MSVKYLLPCSCGEKIVIDVGKAGRTIRCQCGRQVEVPTLREIKKLRQFQQQPLDLASEWSPRRAAALAGAMMAIVAGLSAGWLWLNRPVSPQGEINSQIRDRLEHLEDWSYDRMRKVDNKVANMTVAEIHGDWHQQREREVFEFEMGQNVKQSGELTFYQAIIEGAKQDRRLIEYRQQEQLNTNFCYIALAVALAGAAICGTALICGKK